MKGMTMNTIVIILLAVVVLVILVFGINAFKGSAEEITGDWTKYTTQYEQEFYLKELESSYNTYAEGGFDSYEASVFIGEAIDYAWKICYGRCKSETPMFAQFFISHPIELDNTLDCDVAAYKTPDISKINGYCNQTDIGADKTKTVDEWTITLWGLLAQGRLCGDEIKTGTWGNSNCGNSDNSIIDGKKCDNKCKGSPEDDRINWDGKIEKNGKDYIINIKYNPDDSILPFKGKPEIKVEIKEV